MTGQSWLDARDTGFTAESAARPELLIEIHRCICRLMAEGASFAEGKRVIERAASVGRSGRRGA